MSKGFGPVQIAGVSGSLVTCGHMQLNACCRDDASVSGSQTKDCKTGFFLLEERNYDRSIPIGTPSRDKRAQRAGSSVPTDTLFVTFNCRLRGIISITTAGRTNCGPLIALYVNRSQVATVSAGQALFQFTRSSQIIHLARVRDGLGIYPSRKPRLTKQWLHYAVENYQERIPSFFRPTSCTPHILKL